MIFRCFGKIKTIPIPAFPLKGKEQIRSGIKSPPLQGEGWVGMVFNLEKSQLANEANQVILYPRLSALIRVKNMAESEPTARNNL